MLNKPVLLAAEAKLILALDRLRLAPAASCVTVMVCGATPVAVTVMVAVRMLAKGLATAVAVTLPLFEPEAVLTVNQA